MDQLPKKYKYYMKTKLQKFCRKLTINYYCKRMFQKTARKGWVITQETKVFISHSIFLLNFDGWLI